MLNDKITVIESSVYWMSKQSKNIYLFFGGSTGVLTSIFENNGHDILKTFILGASGALGGALIKTLIDVISKKINNKVKLMAWEREHYEMLKLKEQEELLLKREEDMKQQGL